MIHDPHAAYERCPICDRPIGKDTFDICSDSDHWFHTAYYSTGLYFRWTVGELNYSVEVCDAFTRLKLFDSMHEFQIQVDSFDFDAKDPTSVIERLNLLRAYQ